MRGGSEEAIQSGVAADAEKVLGETYEAGPSGKLSIELACLLHISCESFDGVRLKSATDKAPQKSCASRQVFTAD